MLHFRRCRWGRVCIRERGLAILCPLRRLFLGMDRFVHRQHDPADPADAGLARWQDAASGGPVFCGRAPEPDPFAAQRCRRHDGGCGGTGCADAAGPFRAFHRRRLYLDFLSLGLHTPASAPCAFGLRSASTDPLRRRWPFAALNPSSAPCTRSRVFCVWDCFGQQKERTKGSALRPDGFIRFEAARSTVPG